MKMHKLKICVLLCVMGCLLVTLVMLQCVKWGVNSTGKSTQYEYLGISIFEHATPLFGQDAPPGESRMKESGKVREFL